MRGSIRNWLVGAVAVLTASCIGRASAHACECEPADATFEAARRDSARIFEGVVDRVDAERVTFRVRTWWRGGRTETQVLERGHETCRVAFETGKLYLVYARANGDGAVADMCTRTGDAKSPRALEDKSRLGRGIVPPPESPRIAFGCVVAPARSRGDTFAVVALASCGVALRLAQRRRQS